MVGTTTVLALTTIVGTDSVDLVSHMSTGISQRMEDLLTGASYPASNLVIDFNSASNRTLTIKNNGAGDANLLALLWDQGGAFYNVKAYGAKLDGTTDDSASFTAAIAAAGASGGVIYCPTGDCLLSSTVVVTGNINLQLGAGTYTGPSNAPMFRTWSGTTRYSNVTIEGRGQGVTTLKTPNGAAPAGATRCNVIQLTDPTDTTGTHYTDYARIANLSINGNKANVTQPPGGAADDTTHDCIFASTVRYSAFENLELKNAWYCGISGGLYFTRNRIVNVWTYNNGYSNAVGYGGIYIGGTSQANVVTNHISDSDKIGIQIYDNAAYNVVSGVYTNNYHGVNCTDQLGNTSIGNLIRATIYNSGSQALSVGGNGAQRDCRFDVEIDTTTGDAGAYIGANVQECTFLLGIRKANQHGAQLLGHDNMVFLRSSENSQQSGLTYYSLSLEGAVRNRIELHALDNQGVETQRALSLNGASNNNSVIMHRHGASASYVNSGTGNAIMDFYDGSSPRGWDFNRVLATTGASLVAGDFALSAGWGTTATVSNIATGSKDQRGTIVVTSNGVNQAANPTVTLTFKDGTWQNAPFALCKRNGGAQPTVDLTWTLSASALVITFVGTPVAAETYTISWIVIG